MKRRSRYDDKVIAFAVTERRRGAKWKEIVNTIAHHFAIKPPTERQMRKWYQEYGIDAGDPERLLRENLVKVARATTPIAAFTTQKFAVEQVPYLVEAWKQGKDPWIAGGIMVLSMLEQIVGSDKFNQLLKEYQLTRQPTIAPTFGEDKTDTEPAKN
ncbi:hypothetical protein ACFLV5_01670 [Chloroflexota bacterium]